jgi:membrane-associated phospholipid phosphatase
MPLFLARSRFRASEWVLISFFAYISVLVPFFPERPELHDQPFFILAAAAILFCCLSVAEQGSFAANISRVRDWVPLGLTLLAFREMDLFLPAHYDLHYESAWIRWDRVMLYDWHLRSAIESLGPVIPFYLELCYLLVYGLGAYCIIVLWMRMRRTGVDLFYVLYLLGTLIAYGLFPYFPSQPPRIAFPQVAPPHFTGWLRQLNLALLNGASIHSGVFPSAHVSSAFSAAWAMFLLFPGRKLFAWGVLLYAISVSVATIYGRYHYVADVLSGIAVSMVPASLAIVIHFRRSLLKERAVAPTTSESTVK